MKAKKVSDNYMLKVDESFRILKKLSKTFPELFPIRPTHRNIKKLPTAIDDSTPGLLLKHLYRVTYAINEIITVLKLDIDDEISK